MLELITLTCFSSRVRAALPLVWRCDRAPRTTCRGKGEDMLPLCSQTAIRFMARCTLASKCQSKRTSSAKVNGRYALAGTVKMRRKKKKKQGVDIKWQTQYKKAGATVQRMRYGISRSSAERGAAQMKSIHVVIS